MTSKLTVQTLGSFSVWRDSALIPEMAWRRDKAKQLLQYLLTVHGRMTLKERLITELWPALDATRADRDFKVALNALVTALQPERPSRAPSAYIRRQGSAYGLETAVIDLDVTEFVTGLMTASRQAQQDEEQAVSTYRQALTLYQGDYLPDALYEDWASAERERLAMLFMNGATELARLLLRRGETVELVSWCQRVLTMDACWEEAYRLLMVSYLARGNRPQALKTYQRCVTALNEELAIPPMAETMKLYERALAETD